MFFRIFLFVISFLSVGLLNAQTCCSGGIPLSNNIGLNFSDADATLFSLSYDYNYLNTLKNESNVLDDNSRLRTTTSILLNVGHSFGTKFTLEGLFTWVRQTRRITQFGNQNLDVTSGIGDAVVLGNFAVLSNPLSSTNLRLGLGVKVPLGSTTEKNSQGIVLNADLQPGSGAWDLLYVITVIQQLNLRPSLSLSFRSVYRQTGTNSEYLGNSAYKFGNEFQAYLGLVDQFLIKTVLINPSLTFKYRNARKDTIDSNLLPNTGGNWIFIMPNISVLIARNLNIYATGELPIYAVPDGLQLTPTYRITAGFIYSFLSKPKIEKFQ